MVQQKPCLGGINVTINALWPLASIRLNKNVTRSAGYVNSTLRSYYGAYLYEFEREIQWTDPRLYKNSKTSSFLRPPAKFDTIMNIVNVKGSRKGKRVSASQIKVERLRSQGKLEYLFLNARLEEFGT